MASEPTDSHSLGEFMRRRANRKSWIGCPQRLETLDTHRARLLHTPQLFSTLSRRLTYSRSHASRPRRPYPALFTIRGTSSKSPIYDVTWLVLGRPYRFSCVRSKRENTDGNGEKVSAADDARITRHTRLRNGKFARAVSANSLAGKLAGVIVESVERNLSTVGRVTADGRSRDRGSIANASPPLLRPAPPSSFPSAFRSLPCRRLPCFLAYARYVISRLQRRCRSFGIRSFPVHDARGDRNESIERRKTSRCKNPAINSFERRRKRRTGRQEGRRETMGAK